MREPHIREIERRNREIASGSDQSDPLFHGPIGLRLIDWTGGPFAMPLRWLVNGSGLVLLVVVALSMTSPSILSRATKAVEGVTRLQLPTAQSGYWFWLFVAMTLISTLLAYLKDQRRHLINEGRLLSHA